MFPKCSLDVPNIPTLREHSVNIPGILCAGWERAAVTLLYHETKIEKYFSLEKLLLLSSNYIFCSLVITLLHIFPRFSKKIKLKFYKVDTIIPVMAKDQPPEN